MLFGIFVDSSVLFCFFYIFFFSCSGGSGGDGGFVCVYMCVWVCMCMCVYVYVCVCVCVCVYVPSLDTGAHHTHINCQLFRAQLECCFVCFLPRVTHCLKSSGKRLCNSLHILSSFHGGVCASITSSDRGGERESILIMVYKGKKTDVNGVEKAADGFVLSVRIPK